VEVAQALFEEGIPAAASFHAGTFACNAALYLALRSSPAHTPVGFLHLPRRNGPDGTGLPHLIRAVKLALRHLEEAAPLP
jgi:pyrrolidone-carboxylate peptidase